MKQKQQELQNISFILEKFWNIHRIASACFDSDKTLIFQFSSEEKNAFSRDEELFQQNFLDAFVQSETVPLLRFYDSRSIYGGFHTKHGFHILIGSKLFQSTQNHSFDSGLETFTSILSLLFFTITGIAVQEVDIISNIENTFTELKKEYSVQTYLLDNTEREISHFSYNLEQEMMQQITNGDVDAILHPKQISDIQRIGKFARNTFKQYEYMACSSITLSTRAAIQGGLDPLTAYAISDLAKQRLEQCQTPNQISALQRSVRLDLAKKVKELKERQRSSSHVEKAKVYISNHLNVHFTLQDVADEIGVNSSYLSRRFSQEVGTGIQKYTLALRIKASSNMLKYSDERISDIANYLCFPSQSHFCKVFRETMGCTPLQYRKREKTVDF